MQGIYKITNNINGKIYIGRTNNSDRRWKDHQRLAFTPNQKEYDKALYRAMRKYGLENFNFEIIEQLDDYSFSGERERYWISYYNSYEEGYNENLGGDGGSAEGHCKGETNGRAKLTEQDVIVIRTKFREGCSKSDCFQLFKDKISLGGFARVWQGKTWKHIMPEVYTKENIQRNAYLGRKLGSKKQRLYSEEEVKIIRQQKKNGMKRQECFEKFGKGSINTFQDIWYNRTYQEVT